MRCVEPSKKQPSFDTTEFRRYLFKNEGNVKEYLSNLNYSLINTFVYKDIVKRKKLWNVEKDIATLPEKGYKTFLSFINNTVDFLAIRENGELFQYMNEFYNLILKAIFIISLSYKKRLFEKYIENISNFDGGRIDAIRPMRTKPFNKMSKDQLSNIVVFFSYKQGFMQFRNISKKFHQCFEQHLIFIVSQVPNVLKQYSDVQINEAKDEIRNNLTIVDRINLLGESIRNIQATSNNLTEQKMFKALKMFKKDEDCKVQSDENGMPVFQSNANFRD